MPIVHVSLRKGKPEAYRQAILDGIYQSLRDVLNVPEDDQFMTLTEHDAVNFRHGKAFDVDRSKDLIYIRITVFDNRPAEQKKALYKNIAALLGKNPGVRSEDVFINIYDTPVENWSVGHGIAQFA